jgi:hypothetical protein
MKTIGNEGVSLLYLCSSNGFRTKTGFNILLKNSINLNLIIFFFNYLKAKIKDIIISIENNDVSTLKSLMDKKYLGYYRDDQGRSPLIHAIQKQNLEIAAFLIEKFPFLLKINDAVRFARIIFGY